MTAVHDQLAEQGIGRRLRDARERAGLSTSEVAARLKMPVRVIDSLEAEDWGRAGAPVFVRGQIRSYAKLVGLSQDIRATGAMVAIAPPVLKPRTYTPPLQRFAEQASRRAVYIVLTAAILVPVWLATRSQSGAGSAASLDGQPPSAEAAGAVREPATVRASIAPIPPRAARPVLALEFDGDSWVEIHAADGSVVESGLLRAGDRRTFTAGQISRIKLGNAAAVRVLNNGREQDLAPYLRASVARFAVSSDGSLAPPAE